MGLVSLASPSLSLSNRKTYFSLNQFAKVDSRSLNFRRVYSEFSRGYPTEFTRLRIFHLFAIFARQRRYFMVLCFCHLRNRASDKDASPERAQRVEGPLFQPEHSTPVFSITCALFAHNGIIATEHPTRDASPERAQRVEGPLFQPSTSNPCLFIHFCTPHR